MPKEEISNEEDVKKLVDLFYTKVVEDHIIGPVFTDVMKVDWDKHLSIMYSFWSSILLGSYSYSGNPMTKHIQIDRQFALEAKHFNRWLKLWKETLHENFEGENVKVASLRAENIARLMQHKINEANS